MPFKNARTITRRQALRTLCGGSAALVLAACTPTPTPVPTAAPTAKPAATAVPPTAKPAATAVPPTAVPPTAAPKPALPSGQKATLRFISFESADEAKTFQTAADQYAGTVAGLTIEVQAIPWAQYEEKVMAMVAANTPPDAIYVTDRRSIGWADKGILADIKLFTDTQPALLKDFSDAAVKHYVWKGKQYIFPSDIGLIVYGYNKTLYEKQGAKTPYDYWKEGNWTWDTFLEVLKGMTKDTNNDGKVDQYGFIVNPSWIGDVPTFLWQNGGDILSADGTQCTLSSPESMEALQFVADLFNKHKVVPPLTAAGQQNPFSFLSGNISMDVYNTASTQTWRTKSEGWIFDGVPRPVKKGKESLGRHYDGGAGYAVFNGGKYKDVTWGLILHLLGSAFQNERAKAVGRIPSRLAEAAEYLKVLGTGEEPVHIDGMVDALKTTRFLNLHPAFAEIDTIRVEVFDSVWREGTSVEKAAKDACARITPILQR